MLPSLATLANHFRFRVRILLRDLRHLHGNHYNFLVSDNIVSLFLLCALCTKTSLDCKMFPYRQHIQKEGGGVNPRPPLLLLPTTEGYDFRVSAMWKSAKSANFCLVPSRSYSLVMSSPIHPPMRRAPSTVAWCVETSVAKLIRS